MKQLTLILLLLFSSFDALLAQSFTAKIEPVNGYYRLTFTVTTQDAEGFTPPALNDFEKLSGPSVSTFSNFQMINGKTSHSETTTYTYILSAKKAGRIVIGSASIRAKGKVLRSRPIALQAQAGPSGGNSTSSSSNASRQSADEQLQRAGSAVTQRDLFIDLTPSRTRIREQEAVLLTYRIHSRLGVGLSNTQLTTKPDFKDLLSQEIPLPGNQIQTTLETRAGGTYRTGTILQYVVFPQKSGKITIPSIVFDCTVIQQDPTMDLADLFFNGGGNIGVQVRRKVPEMTLDVEALPTPKPANFSGAVGNFKIQAKVMNPQVKSNDVSTLRVTLNGLGNMKLITPPQVKFPNDFETYDAKTNENTQLTANGLSGQLTFDYTFVPRNKGDYTLEPIEFVYFDTESGTYQTIRTAPISLKVAQGERSNADVEKQLALLHSDIRDIQPANAITSTPRFLQWGTAGFRIIQFVLVLLLATAFYLLRRYRQAQGDVLTRRRTGAGKQAAKRLREAEALLQSPRPADFYNAVSKAFTGYLSDTFNLGQADFSRERIESLLREHHAEAATIEALLALMDECEFAQYAPGADTKRQEIYNQALQVMERLGDVKL